MAEVSKAEACKIKLDNQFIYPLCNLMSINFADKKEIGDIRPSEKSRDYIEEPYTDLDKAKKAENDKEIAK